MEKFLPILIVGILVISGIGAVAIGDEPTDEYEIEKIFEHINIDYSSFYIKESYENYIEVELANKEKIIENNEGKYFIYYVGTAEIEEPRELLSKDLKESIKELPSRPQEYFKPIDSDSTTNIINNHEI